MNSKFWIPNIRTLYLREQVCENPWLLFEVQRGSYKSLENTGLKEEP
jgi:hypothetical protein